MRSVIIFAQTVLTLICYGQVDLGVPEFPPGIVPKRSRSRRSGALACLSERNESIERRKVRIAMYPLREWSLANVWDRTHIKVLTNEQQEELTCFGPFSSFF